MDVAEFHTAGTVDYFLHERGADLVREWANGAVSGLVQTSAYAEAWLREFGIDETPTQAKVAHRMARQREVLARSEVRLILDEAVLHRAVGGPEVMREQLEALLVLPAAVDLMVVPFSVGAHRGLYRPFHLLDGPCGRVLYLDDPMQDRTLTSGPLIPAYEAVWRSLEAVAVPAEPLIVAALDRLTSSRP